MKTLRCIRSTAVLIFIAESLLSEDFNSIFFLRLMNEMRHFFPL